MADTSFSDLYAEIRTVCGDWGVEDRDSVIGDYIFRNDMIVNALKVILLDIEDYSDSGSDAVTPEFAKDSDRLLIIYSTAFLLLLSEEEIQYQTRDERFNKKINKDKLMNVATKLQALEMTDGIPSAYDGSVAAIMNMGGRWANYLSTILEY